MEVHKQKWWIQDDLSDRNWNLASKNGYYTLRFAAKMPFVGSRVGNAGPASCCPVLGGSILLRLTK